MWIRGSQVQGGGSPGPCPSRHGPFGPFGGVGVPRFLASWSRHLEGQVWKRGALTLEPKVRSPVWVVRVSPWRAILGSPEKGPYLRRGTWSSSKPSVSLVSAALGLSIGCSWWRGAPMGAGCVWHGNHQVQVGLAGLENCLLKPHSFEGLSTLCCLDPLGIHAPSVPGGGNPPSPPMASSRVQK